MFVMVFINRSEGSQVTDILYQYTSLKFIQNRIIEEAKTIDVHFINILSNQLVYDQSTLYLPLV